MQWLFSHVFVLQPYSHNRFLYKLLAFPMLVLKQGEAPTKSLHETDKTKLGIPRWKVTQFLKLAQMQTCSNLPACWPDVPGGHFVFQKPSVQKIGRMVGCISRPTYKAQQPCHSHRSCTRGIHKMPEFLAKATFLNSKCQACLKHVLLLQWQCPTSPALGDI